MKYMVLAFIVLLLGLPACRTGKSTTDASGAYRALAEQKFGTGVEYLFNAPRSAVLCVHKAKETSQSLQRRVAFMIVDLSSNKSVFEDTLPDGSVSWKDDFTILVLTVPGIEKTDPKPEERISGYTFDLRTRKTRQLGIPDVK